MNSVLDSIPYSYRQFVVDNAELFSVLLASYVVMNILFSLLLFLGWKPPQRWTLPPDIEQHVIQMNDGVNIVAWCKGRGPDIVLLHSSGGTSMHFAFLFKRLAIKGFRVITYDMRGHGKSSPAKSFSAKDLSADLRNVLEHFNCRTSTLVGYGLGGYIAQALFLHHKHVASQRVNRLLLLSSFSVSPCSFKERIFVATIRSGFVHILCRSKMLSRWICRGLFGAATNNSMLEEWRRSTLSVHPHIWIKAAAAGNYDLKQHQHLVSVPTLVVCGEYDCFYASVQRHHFDHIPGDLERVWLERMGHMTPWEAPDRLTSILCQFVNTNPVRKSLPSIDE